MPSPASKICDQGPPPREPHTVLLAPCSTATSVGVRHQPGDPVAGRDRVQHLGRPRRAGQQPRDAHHLGRRRQQRIVTDQRRPDEVAGPGPGPLPPGVAAVPAGPHRVLGDREQRVAGRLAHQRLDVDVREVQDLPGVARVGGAQEPALVRRVEHVVEEATRAAVDGVPGRAGLGGRHHPLAPARRDRPRRAYVATSRRGRRSATARARSAGTSRPGSRRGTPTAGHPRCSDPPAPSRARPGGPPPRSRVRPARPGWWSWLRR